MSIPHIEMQNGQKVLYVHDSPFVMLSGEVHNSSSSSAEYMEDIWRKTDEWNLNSLLLPVSWEMIEPKEGQFDFSVVEQLIMQARAYNKKIGFLWFGAWKNAQCYYAPEWIKKDLGRYKRAQVQKGKNYLKLEQFHGFPYTTLSAFCEETKQADANAFAKLMTHIKEFDAEENTVIVIQVENETGVMGCAREHSDEADVCYSQAVPGGLLTYLKNRKGELSSELSQNFVRECKEGDTWKQVFGNMSEEIFTAYHTAAYVNTVASAGKESYPLPMAVNCWLDKKQEPGRYPTGGPVAKLIDIWQYAAPAIDVIAPDIYVPYFSEVCDEYHVKGNPLFIAECETHSYAAAREIYTVAHHHAMCYAPFGIEDLGQRFNAMQGRLFGMETEDDMLKTPQSIAEYTKVNQLLQELLPQIGKAYGSARLQGCSIEQEVKEGLIFDPFVFRPKFQSEYIENRNGACLVLQATAEEFYVIALGCLLQIDSGDSMRPNIDFLCVEEGNMVDGIFTPKRRLNGDEVAVFIVEDPTLLRIKLFCYKHDTI